MEGAMGTSNREGTRAGRVGVLCKYNTFALRKAMGEIIRF